VGTYEWKQTHFVLQNVVSTLPQGWEGESTASEIKMHPTLPILYVANRGHDSVAVFSVRDDGVLALEQSTGCGKFPRHINVSLDGTIMYVANQIGGTIELFTLLENGFISSRLEEIPCSGASCILPLN
jgi:6-phosphogluconolactonase (cycloisomerase 2 family)